MMIHSVNNFLDIFVCLVQAVGFNFLSKVCIHKLVDLSK